MIDCGSFKLRPLEFSDAENLCYFADNIRIWRNVRDTFPHPYTYSDAESFIHLSKGNYKGLNFGIEYAGRCCGVIGMVQQSDVYRKSAELGYWIGEPFWGRGIMTEAVKAFVPYVFSGFDIVRLYAGVFDWNIASMQVLEKAGFQLEGVFRKAILKEGRLMDEYRYGLLRPGF